MYEFDARRGSQRGVKMSLDAGEGASSSPDHVRLGPGGSSCPVDHRL